MGSGGSSNIQVPSAVFPGVSRFLEVGTETVVLLSGEMSAEVYLADKKYDFNKSLKELTITDLKARIDEDQLRLKKLEFAHAISPLENPMSIRGLRKDIARLKTELKKKELGI